MSNGQKFGITLLILAYFGGTLFAKFGKQTWIGTAIIGAIILIFDNAEGAQ